MAVTYTWTVTSMNVMQTPQADTVVQAQYACSGTDGTYSAVMDSVMEFEVEEGGSFTPYADLTQDQVVGWIKESLGEAGVLSVTASLDGQIDSQANPPVSPQSEALPW